MLENAALIFASRCAQDIRPVPAACAANLGSGKALAAGLAPLVGTDAAHEIARPSGRAMIWPACCATACPAPDNHRRKEIQ